MDEAAGGTRVRGAAGSKCTQCRGGQPRRAREQEVRLGEHVESPEALGTLPQRWEEPWSLPDFRHHNIRLVTTQTAPETQTNQQRLHGSTEDRVRPDPQHQSSPEEEEML